MLCQNDVTHLDQLCGLVPEQQLFDCKCRYTLCSLLRGNLIEEVLPSTDTTGSSYSSNQTLAANDTLAGNDTDARDGGQSRLVLEPMHTLTSSGPTMMLYFYSDIAEERSGFNLSYW